MNIYKWDNNGDIDFNTGTLLEYDGKYSSGAHGDTRSPGHLSFAVMSAENPVVFFIK